MSRIQSQENEGGRWGPWLSTNVSFFTIRVNTKVMTKELYWRSLQSSDWWLQLCQVSITAWDSIVRISDHRWWVPKKSDFALKPVFIFSFTSVFRHWATSLLTSIVTCNHFDHDPYPGVWSTHPCVIIPCRNGLLWYCRHIGDDKRTVAYLFLVCLLFIAFTG